MLRYQRALGPPQTANQKFRFKRRAASAIIAGVGRWASEFHAITMLSVFCKESTYPLLRCCASENHLGRFEFIFIKRDIEFLMLLFSQIPETLTSG
jgi:hypothetical protein